MFRGALQQIPSMTCDTLVAFCGVTRNDKKRSQSSSHSGGPQRLCPGEWCTNTQGRQPKIGKRSQAEGCMACGSQQEGSLLGLASSLTMCGGVAGVRRCS